MNDKAFAFTLSDDKNYTLTSIKLGNVKDLTLGVVKDDGHIYNELINVVFNRELKVGDIVWSASWEANKIDEYEAEPGIWLPVFGIPKLRGNDKSEVTSVSNNTYVKDLFLYENIEVRKYKEE